ncbi:hypothetical protein [Actinomadura sp. NBRC 104425]|uniref:hypothetical protein n=1 Tax=Actinomadura sp. NBRC 104425 TaxID=3032204 RepID=UPI002556AC65|nr:hypothetical protein [Actinomadura sp. NBRC 104425]
MNGDQDGRDGHPSSDVEPTAPIRPPAAGLVDEDDLPPEAAPAGVIPEERAGRHCVYCGRPVPAGAGPDALFCGDAHRVAYTGEAAARDDEAAPVRALAQDVDRLAALVTQLADTAAVLGDRLDDEVRGVIGRAEEALAEARSARRAAAEADDRAELAEARAEAARQEAADAIEELRAGMAAAKASVTAAQNSEANAWKEAGAAQQARAAAANEAAHAEGLRKRAEAAWNTERQARAQLESERDDLLAQLATEQSALAMARTELEEARAEADDAFARLEAAAKTERDLRAELAAAHSDIQRLTVELDAAAARAAEQAARADRAEQLADDAIARLDDAQARADRAEQRVDAAVDRADRDAAALRALQDTLRSALDLPSVEDLGDDQGVRFGGPGEAGAVLALPGGLIGLDGVPDVLDGETAARFARAVLAVRVHQATRRSHPDDDAPAAQDGDQKDGGGEA